LKGRETHRNGGCRPNSPDVIYYTNRVAPKDAAQLGKLAGFLSGN